LAPGTFNSSLGLKQSSQAYSTLPLEELFHFSTLILQESKANEYGQNLISESSHEEYSPFMEPALPNREINPCF